MKNELYDGPAGEAKRGEYSGFTYKIVNRRGYPCAYVKIPEENILYNIPYSHIDIDVHGGLTYSEMEPDGYWIGWDYAHDLDFINYGWAETTGFKEWTVVEIEDECKRAITQISHIKKFQKKEYYFAEKERSD